MSKALLFVTASFVLAATSAGASAIGADDETRAAVERAVLDYAEAYYEVNPDYVERSIHPELVKLGFVATDGKYVAQPMTYDGFMGMVRWFEDSDRVPDPGPKEVVVLDALDQTALVKLTGSWGTDYMQLAKFDGRWQTRHVLWQTAPIEPSSEARTADRAAIERAAADYVEAFYDVKPELAERSVDASLAKIGYARRTADAPYVELRMTYAELLALAAEWNADGERAGTTSPRKIEVLDAMDQTACVKLTAEWGVDYMNLAKVDGEWKILHVLWQSTRHAANAE